MAILHALRSLPGVSGLFSTWSKVCFIIDSLIHSTTQRIWKTALVCNKVSHLSVNSALRETARAVSIKVMVSVLVRVHNVLTRIIISDVKLPEQKLKLVFDRILRLIGISRRS